MSVAPKIPLRLAVGLALAIALDTAVQLAWKAAVASLPDTASPLAAAEAVAHQPVFLGVALLFAGQLVNWLRVLDDADLSFAQPITSLSYVSVCVLSAVFLGERMAPLQIVGIGFVLAGVWFISGTGHTTEAPSEAHS